MYKSIFVGVLICLIICSVLLLKLYKLLEVKSTLYSIRLNPKYIIILAVKAENAIRLKPKKLFFCKLRLYLIALEFKYKNKVLRDIK